NFEVVAPVFAPDGTMELWHYFHDNSDPNLPWQRAQRIAANIASSGSIIQSDFGGEHKNFEVVVPLVEGSQINLWHFWRDNGDPSTPWQRAQRIATGVDGPACMIQSDFRGEHGNFEVVVPRLGVSGLLELWHFWRENDDTSTPWRQGQRIAVGVRGPAVLIQSDFISGGHGNFELVVPMGPSLVHFWRDNSDPSTPWQPGQLISDASTGWGSILQSDFRDGEHGNFEVLADECSQSLVAYWHPNRDVNLPWLWFGPLISEPYPAQVTGARKIVQLTGEFDREGWNGEGTPALAFNQTESRYGIRGCDLGSSFEHRNRIFFLFGDTVRVNDSPWRMNLDSIAFTTDTSADSGLHLTFYKQPPLVGDIDQLAFNVPLDGFSWNDAMYVFFSTDHYNIGATDPLHPNGYDVMGRSVLARSDNDGYDYVPLREFSRNKFVNVSVEIGILGNEAAVALNLSVGTEVVWVWGSGRYRSSAVYLAMFLLKEAENLGGLRFYAGRRSWSWNEADAAPLFCAQDVGELSVRWNPVLQRYLALFNSANPGGILMHSAPTPWGPWSSAPVMIFDPAALQNSRDPCSGAGLGRFMHIPWSVRKCDQVQDDLFGGWRDDEWAGVYGPYQITRFTRPVDQEAAQIFFTMSTWNPYQSVLMTAVIARKVI
ncbi:MAG TPA: DUF4185 domain-containing protein, partial [Terriglobales bacterium]|nr:DUF4185 domain-containing protein [Terriglobales bacterium]